MVQMAGSNVEEYEKDSESKYRAGEKEGGKSGSNRGTDVEEGKGVGAGSENSSCDESGGTGGGEVTAEEILEFLRKEWDQDFSMFQCIPDYSDQYTQGLHLQNKAGHAPLDCFVLIILFDRDFLTHIVRETNLYAQENITARGVLCPQSTFCQWKNITMKDLIGVFLPSWCTWGCCTNLKFQTSNWCEKYGKSLSMDKLAWGKNKTRFQVYHTVKNYAEYWKIVQKYFVSFCWVFFCVVSYFVEYITCIICPVYLSVM